MTVGRLMSPGMKLKQAVFVTICPGLEANLGTLRLIPPHQLIMGRNTSRNSNQHYGEDGNLGMGSHESLQHVGNFDRETRHRVLRVWSMVLQ